MHLYIDLYLQNFTQNISLTSDLLRFLRNLSHGLSIFSFFLHFSAKFLRNFGHEQPNRFGQALDLLVLVSYTCYHASTSNLSTLSSSRGLTSLRYGISHLEGGFTLICLQRLSLPNFATLPCRWSTTDTPEVRPSRSSRTKDSSSQISYAHAG